MKRSGRINDVVPVVERLVKDHLSVEPGLERFSDLSSSLVDLADDSRKHLQSGLCSGFGSSFASILNRKQKGFAQERVI